ncbi:hypothetical protein HMPREF1870_00692 [Bacteroidales bacterium KA00344]|nr:hypothetical protein HMPREF1870_00692 [Bacteroidales bacterium KA00344]
MTAVGTNGNIEISHPVISKSNSTARLMMSRENMMAMNMAENCHTTKREPH